MQTGLIIEAAQQYVTAQYKEHPHPKLVYHNLEHTRQVVAAAEQISAHYRLENTDLLIVYIAAWFHDLGYLLGEAKTHEEKGAELAVNFLNIQQVPLNIQQQVKDCIMATKMPQDPHNLLEQIVCDADLFNLGTKDFKNRTKLLHQEMELTYGKEIPGAVWTEGSLRLLEEQHYHTAYCRTLLQQQIEENIARLKEKLEKQLEKARKKNKGEAKQVEAVVVAAGKKGAKEDDAEAAYATVEKLIAERKNGDVKEPEKNNKDKKKEKEKEPKPGRGVETMFRTTSTNHIRLSSMADSKAHIMISVNSIIVSVILGVLFRRLEDYPNLIIPAVIFLLTGVVTIIFAVLATRPNVNTGTFTREDIDRKKTNLLFFGNFHKVSLEDYTWGMTEMMKDTDYVYASMIQDIYHLGVVLGKKYKQLRIAYNVFMFGLVISVLAFMIAVLFFPVKN
ncbi:Predicted metal-dependent phosphohydrolase, HD superfamily [Chitinophaga sp. CF118]|uniref:Pycsar system effector family protein n=1 Tax=Chitinophaga sp. CF118 TaxID=1884367 RepID=UPI0008E9E0D6|nr:Pycsar system effector family protein [Chitinophaga sp. CF118]SFE36157.1 Predicted metal-dependent phosphohydrolase, HD superfamily [Chitinophaga sp. CF118]